MKDAGLWHKATRLTTAGARPEAKVLGPEAGTLQLGGQNAI